MRHSSLLVLTELLLFLYVIAVGTLLITSRVSPGFVLLFDEYLSATLVTWLLNQVRQVPQFLALFLLPGLLFSLLRLKSLVQHEIP